MHERHCAQQTYRCPICKWVKTVASPAYRMSMYTCIHTIQKLFAMNITRMCTESVHYKTILLHNYSVKVLVVDDLTFHTSRPFRLLYLFVLARILWLLQQQCLICTSCNILLIFCTWARGLWYSVRVYVTTRYTLPFTYIIQVCCIWLICDEYRFFFTDRLCYKCFVRHVALFAHHCDLNRICNVNHMIFLQRLTLSSNRRCVCTSTHARTHKHAWLCVCTCVCICWVCAIFFSIPQDQCSIWVCMYNSMLVKCSVN